MDWYLVEAPALSLEEFRELCAQLDGVGLAKIRDPEHRAISAYVPEGKTPADLVQLPAGVTFRKMNQKF